MMKLINWLEGWESGWNWKRKKQDELSKPTRHDYNRLIMISIIIKRDPLLLLP